VSTNAVVIAVGSYPTRAAARQDFQQVCRLEDEASRCVAAAVVEKGADGLLTIDRPKAAERLVCGAALLGGALIVVAAPLGMLYLVPVVATKTAWAGVGAIVAHFWNNVPKAELRHMTDLLEATQAALVVVAVDRDHDEIRPLLANASSAVVADASPVDLEEGFSLAVDEAEITSG
jgi:hypothetical protein